MAINVSNNNPRVVYTVGATPQTDFVIPFDFFDTGDVNVYVDGSLQTHGSDYTMSGAGADESPIVFTTAVSNCEVAITRDVPLERTTDFTSTVGASAMNDQLDRIVAQIADIDDKASRSLQLDDYEVAADLTIPSKDSRKGYTLAFNSSTGNPEVGPLVVDVAAANTNAANAAASATAAAASESAAGASESAAATSASNAASSASSAASSASDAATSETNAATSETNAANSATASAASAATATAKATSAATSATNAAGSETNAANFASNAASSATSAASAQTAAETARDQTLSVYDSFDDRYLGTHSSDPTVDNDGNALVAGSLYFSSTDEVMKVYTGSAWVAAYASLSGALLVANNLSDLGNASDARVNLGLGTAATSASTDFVAVTGDSMTGNLSLGDNVKATFGASSDLQIYHDGSNSYIDEAGAGNLILRAHDRIYLKNYGTDENHIIATANGAVDLYCDNALKLATTSTGVDVTGNITVSGTVDGRDVAVDGTKLDGIETGATADQTAAEIMTAIQTVDGAGSGLDADLLDGIHASSFLQDNGSGATLTLSNWIRTTGNTGWYNATYAGGIYMQDTTWVRTYGSKGFYTDQSIAAAGNVIAYYSDERLKTKTGYIENAIKKVQSLSGFYYVENDAARELGYSSDKEQVALSAQDVQAVMPHAVSLCPADMETLKDGTIVSKSGKNYLTVDYARLVPMLVEAIKEQQTQIDELEAKLEAVQ